MWCNEMKSIFLLHSSLLHIRARIYTLPVLECKSPRKKYTCIEYTWIYYVAEIIRYLKANIHIHRSEERDYPRVGNFMYSKTFSTCKLRQEAKCLKTLSPEKNPLIDSINFPMKVLLKTCIKQFTSCIIQFYLLLYTVCVFSLLISFSCHLLEFVLFAVPPELMVSGNGEADLEKKKKIDVLLKCLKLMSYNYIRMIRDFRSIPLVKWQRNTRSRVRKLSWPFPIAVC